MSAKLRPPHVRPGHVLRLLGPLVTASLLVGVALAVCWPLHWVGPAGTSLPGDALEGDEVLPLADDGAAVAKGPVINSIGMTMIRIPPGEFMMGSPPAETDRDPDEMLHRVRITKPFYLSAYEVTVGQFGRFVEETGYVPGSEKAPPLSIYRAAELGRREWAITWRTPPFPQDDDHPVLCVTWDDAVQFCEWLSRKEGHNYRLPTEAEWEYACRAGSSTRFCSGDTNEDLRRFSNVLLPRYNANGGYECDETRGPARRSSPVGKFQANAFGLYDMHGNASEWCSDFYDPDYYERSPRHDPQGPATGEQRVQRGGSFFLASRYARSANRTGFPPTAAHDASGFRPARDCQ
jgi:sulfatase modifying factor 1